MMGQSRVNGLQAEAKNEACLDQDTEEGTPTDVAGDSAASGPAFARSREHNSMEGYPAGVRMEECEAEQSVNSESLDRALGLLATWVLRRARVSAAGRKECGENRVTGGGTKGYGGRNVDY